MTTQVLYQRTGSIVRAESEEQISSVAQPVLSPLEADVPSVHEEVLLEPEGRGKTVKATYGTLLNTYGDEFKLPDFTIKQIRDAIPSHCFERSALRGFSYIARDILLLASTFALWRNFVTPDYISWAPLRFGLWTVYGFLQGLFGTGLWVIAHECGHQSFSPSKTLNDATGWILHSALLVPYFSWKISHGKHHKSTGHMDRDMVFLPKTREVYARRVGRYVHELSELAEETPIVTALILFGRQLIGWPMYLLQNKTGHDNHQHQSEGRGKGKKNGPFGGVNHFSPASPLYEAKDAKYIALSDLGLGLMALILFEIAQAYGWKNVFIWYFVPYLWVNHWLGKAPRPFLQCTQVGKKLALTQGLSRDHIPSAHGSYYPTLRFQIMELYPWSCNNNRPRVWIHRALTIPRNH